jgi:hypothetical protein
MIGLFSLFLALVASPLKSKSRLEAENAVSVGRFPGCGSWKGGVAGAGLCSPFFNLRFGVPETGSS